MADWLALPSVVSASGRDARAVAWRDGALLRRARFRADVAAWRAAFARDPGRRVALYFDDGYAFACALFGAWHAGKEVLLPGDAQPATLERLLPDVDACAGALPGALEPNDAPPPAEPPAEPLDVAATRLVVYTSGSSGEPTAIPKTLAQLDAEVHTLESAFGARVGDATVLATVSHQHIYGLLFCTLWPLAAGRPFVAQRLDYPEQIAARSHGPSLLVTSPAHLRRLPQALAASGARSALRAVFSSGGPLPADAADASLALLGQSPIEVFGSSETGGIASRQRAADGDRWRALPGVQWRLDDGLLSVRSRHLPDRDWWPSADRAEALPDGGFVLLGRADRIVKVEEKRVSLTAIERALAACDEVVEARALAVDGASRLGVVAVPSDAGRALLRERGKRALNERLRDALLARVERVALPRHWRYVDALPVNAQGKATEALLAALFRPLRPSAEWTSREAERARARLHVGAELAVFDGHFPGQPILPGVAQLDWAIELARECFALPPRFSHVEALKFQRPVRPGTDLELALQWDAARRTLGFRYASALGDHGHGRVVFGADDV